MRRPRPATDHGRAGRRRRRRVLGERNPDRGDRAGREAAGQLGPRADPVPAVEERAVVRVRGQRDRLAEAVADRADRAAVQLRRRDAAAAVAGLAQLELDADRRRQLRRRLVREPRPGPGRLILDRDRARGRVRGLAEIVALLVPAPERRRARRHGQRDARVRRVGAAECRVAGLLGRIARHPGRVGRHGRAAVVVGELHGQHQRGEQGDDGRQLVVDADGARAARAAVGLAPAEEALPRARIDDRVQPDARPLLVAPLAVVLGIVARARMWVTGARRRHGGHASRTPRSDLQRHERAALRARPESKRRHSQGGHCSTPERRSNDPSTTLHRAPSSLPQSVAPSSPKVKERVEVRAVMETAILGA